MLDDLCDRFNAVRLERRKSGLRPPYFVENPHTASMLSGLNAGNQEHAGQPRHACSAASMLSGLNAGNQVSLSRYHASWEHASMLSGLNAGNQACPRKQAMNRLL